MGPAQASEPTALSAAGGLAPALRGRETQSIEGVERAARLLSQLRSFASPSVMDDSCLAGRRLPNEAQLVIKDLRREHGQAAGLEVLAWVPPEFSASWPVVRPCCCQ